YRFFLLLGDFLSARCLHDAVPTERVSPHGNATLTVVVTLPIPTLPGNADSRVARKWTPPRMRVPGTTIDDAEPCFFAARTTDSGRKIIARKAARAGIPKRSIRAHRHERCCSLSAKRAARATGVRAEDALQRKTSSAAQRSAPACAATHTSSSKP